MHLEKLIWNSNEFIFCSMYYMYVISIKMPCLRHDFGCMRTCV